MKEFGPINQDRLTTQPRPSKLERRGDIFMPGEPGQGEVPPIHHQTPIEPVEAVSQRRSQPASPERQQEVREAWMKRREEQKRGGERITREQLETEETLIRMGIPPISGGSGDEPEDSQGQPPAQEQPAETDAQAPEKRTFKPSTEWQEIPKGVAIPPGATIRMDMESGKSYAKWDTPPETEIEYEFVAESSAGGGGQEPPAPPASPPGGDNGNQDQGETGNVRAEEAGMAGVGPISTEGVSNPQILGELEAVNSLIGERGGVDYEFLKSTQHRLARLSGEDIPGAEKNTAMSRLAVLIADKETEMRHLSKEERSRELAREITGQTGHNLEEILIDSKKRDEVFNDLFAGVDATPHEFFERAFNPLTYGMRFERFMDIIRNGSIGKIKAGEEALTEDQQKSLKTDFDRYQTERRVRQSLHDANAILYLPSIKAKQLYESMQQFSSDLGTFAWKMTGVKQMMDIYEAALREDMIENNGYLRPEAVTGTVIKSGVESGKEAVVGVKRGSVEEKTKDRFKQMMKAHLIARKNAQGQNETIPEFKDWEIDRIFTISRGMMIMSERLLSLAAESRLPKGHAQYSSLFLQDVIQSYAPYIHLLGKYGVTAESLAAYLYKEGEGQRLLGDIRRWNPHELREIVKKFTTGGAEAVEEILYSDEAMRYLMRPNPNRAGDIFTWVSWRVIQEPETVSMIQDFLDNGWNQRYPKAPDRLEYRKFIAGFKPTKEEKDGKEKAEKEKDKVKSRRDKKEIDNRMKARMLSEWAIIHPDAPGIDVYKGYAEEREQWIGTAIKLEKQRRDLEKLKSSDPELRIDGEIARGKAITIIKEMVKFQPHRLYLVSPEIRDRLKGRFSDGDLNNALNDLSLVETAILRDRERLIYEEGKKFENLDLTDGNGNGYFRRYFEEAIRTESGEPDTERIEKAIAFAQALKADYNGNTEKYHDEFIKNREYKHGFVLWTGDAPIDEYNANAVGPTAGFARRARDNQNQTEAFEEEIKMLVSLREIKTPDQAIKALMAVYDKIAIYDGGKAKQAIAEKAKGLAYFFGADTLTNVPVLGQMLEQAGKASVAQMVYGKGSGVWHAAETRYFFNELKNRGMLTKADYAKIAKEGFATKLDVVMDIGSAAAQLIALAFILYMMQKIAKEK